MKSRVINSKHFHKHFIGDIPVYVGYTSELKPSLFYGNTEKEKTPWLWRMLSCRSLSAWNFAYCEPCRPVLAVSQIVVLAEHRQRF